MTGEAFAEAIGLLRARPVLWVPGIIAACLLFTGIILQPVMGPFLSGKVDVLAAIIAPLFSGGIYEVVRRADEMRGAVGRPAQSHPISLESASAQQSPEAPPESLEVPQEGAGILAGETGGTSPAGGPGPGRGEEGGIIPGTGTFPGNDSGIGTLFSGATRNYFRILIPTVLVGCAVLLCAGAVLLTLVVAGLSPGPALAGMALLGASVPIAAGTFFYDTAAVLERRGIFDSIRRAVEVAVNRPGQLVSLILGMLILLAGVCFGLMVAFTAVVGERLLPLTTMTPDALSSVTPGEILEMIGPDGLVCAAVLAAVGIAITVPLVFTWKACAFRRITGSVTVIQGEYDSKGRWYKY